MIGSSVRILRHMHSSASSPIITSLPQLVLAASHTIGIARANHAVGGDHETFGPPSLVRERLSLVIALDDHR